MLSIGIHKINSKWDRCDEIIIVVILQLFGWRLLLERDKQKATVSDIGPSITNSNSIRTN